MPAPRVLHGPAIGRHARHPLGAEHCSFDLMRGQHQWRWVESTLQHISEAGFALDWYPLPYERSDVAIDASLGRLELGGKRRGGDRAARPAEDLNDLK